MAALAILHKETPQKQAELTKDLEVKKLAHTVVENAGWLEKLGEEERLLLSEIARIEPLGDFSF